ncbi:hypothetical protein L2E82_21186 [Cichorium intybus]|uniref:Uncharacterized protein n=1 Tax=Cichorium intybus TaxID=13427 RepID=A0ACB9DVQ8_CICIN|nr:hypothetical protein L2E82_21186 [Cichorium intybus]
MEDSMLDLPDLTFDEKVGNKRVRDGEEEINMGRLEKRPSGIFGVNGGGDCDGDSVNEGWEGVGGGIIDTFISNVFDHQNESVTEGREVEVGDLMKSDVIDVVAKDKTEDLSIYSSGGPGADGGGERESGGGGGGGIINTFISNIFHNNGSGDDIGDQAKSDLLNEVVEKIEDLGAVGDGGGDGGGGGGAEHEEHDADKSTEKTNTVRDLSSKDLAGHKLKMRPDDYSERVFFLNNN